MASEKDLLVDKQTSTLKNANQLFLQPIYSFLRKNDSESHVASNLGSLQFKVQNGGEIEERKTAELFANIIDELRTIGSEEARSHEKNLKQIAEKLEITAQLNCRPGGIKKAAHEPGI